MSVLPEIIFKTAIQNGLETVRRDTRLIEQLFRNLSLEDLDSVVKYFSETQIKVELGYPNEPPMLPAIIILLKNESEDAAMLSDFAGTGTPEEFSYYGEIESQIIAGTASLGSLKGEPRIIEGPKTAVSGTSTTITVAGTPWRVNQFKDRDLRIRIVAGNGRGQIREVESNTTNSVTIREPWTNIPNSTSIFEITEDKTDVWGEPAKLFDVRDVTKSVDKYAIMFKASCLLNIIAPTSEIAIMTNALVKAILMILRQKMEEQGIKVARMSSSDVLVQQDMFPTQAFVRSLTIDFIYEFAIFDDSGEPLETIEITFDRMNIELQSTSATVAPTNPTVD